MTEREMNHSALTAGFAFQPAGGLPPIVAAALARAEERRFYASCDAAIGHMLAHLAGRVPAGGRIVELGTGGGVGTAWLVHGLGERTDVTITSVDCAPQAISLASSHGFPSYVRLRCDDARAVLAEVAPVSLLFANAPAGKFDGIEESIGALRPGGVIIVDDMQPLVWLFVEHQAVLAHVRNALLAHPELIATEIESAGAIVATRCRKPA